MIQRSLVPRSCLPFVAPCLVVLAFLASAQGQERPLPQAWDYVDAMRQMVAKGTARNGVVLHIGDSITYSNPYGQWARGGRGQTPEDKAVLQWMHAGADDDTDGWFLARFDDPAGGRSHTACSGIRVDEMLAGGKRGLPSLKQLLARYRPQMTVFMLGTNDVSANRAVAAYVKDMETALDLFAESGCVCILSTIPPHIGRPELARSYNEALRTLARKRALPLIDYEAEILQRRPNDWDGTLLAKGDVHPTSAADGVTAASEPTAENLKRSGYLLRGWLSVQKIAEVKRTVIDRAERSAAPPRVLDAERQTTLPPTGTRFNVTRDTWFSNVGEEANCNLGAAAQLKLKSNQEMSLIDFDAAPLAGKTIERAWLHVKLTGPERLHRVTVSTFSGDWVEGKSPRYQPLAGASSFLHARHPDVPWSFPGSDLTAVCLGQGGTRWRMADASEPDTGRWQHIPIEPSLVASRVAGLSYGLLVFDDTGSEWTRNGEQFQLRHFPNRFVASRESGAASAPYLTIATGEEDKSPPAAPSKLTYDSTGLPPGEAIVSWVSPHDVGAAGVLGYEVRIKGQPVPRWAIPKAVAPGETAVMRCRDLGLAPGQAVEVSVRAVDAAGNRGPELTGKIETSAATVQPLPGQTPTIPTETAPLPKLLDAEIAILDELDKVHPARGTLLPPQPATYLAANHLWSAKGPRIRLHAARSEFVGFQILVRGKIAGLSPRLTFGDTGVRVRFGRYQHVSSKLGPLPDPIVPLDGTFSVPSDDDPVAEQTSGSLLVEAFVPRDMPAGLQRGVLELRAGDATLNIPVELTVWDFALPDVLTFLPEMNCYHLPANELDYYRLAHEHRTVLNRVPYSQNGSMHEGLAPRWDGRQLDWTQWDKRFGPLFDGAAFADLPRRGVPIECFYLPMHENWPSPIRDHYNGSYWADQAFPPEYRQAFVEVTRQMAVHADARGWTRTLFHGFLNNKVDYKRNGWSRGSSPWLLDEPASFQDYWALRYFGRAFHEGVTQAGGRARFAFRCDISRPQWQRNSLDDVLDYNVISGAFHAYRPLALDRRRDLGQVVVIYGGSNAIEQSNVQPAAWSVDSWLWGADGVLPWQTLGTANSWRNADELSLFYPGLANGQRPVPSIRLKAYRRGQQDVEYLALLSQATGQPRWMLNRTVRDLLKLAGERRGTGFVGGEDAGLIHFGDLRPQQLWALRVRVGEELSRLHAKPSPQDFAFSTPRRTKVEQDLGYVSSSSPARMPASTAPPPPPTASSEPIKPLALRGRAVVRDALIDPQTARQNQGSEPRNNRLARRDDVSVWLVKFDLAAVMKAKGVAAGKLKRATVTCFIWDPSSRGQTKVCAFPLKTAWDEATVTWSAPATGKSWLGANGFNLARDAGAPSPAIVVKPDAERDVVDPPVPFSLDVTESVRAWLSGAPNHGWAIAPVVDRSVDDGEFSRFQLFGSEWREVAQTPTLSLEWDAGK